ncbi:hypothetical protein [Mycobacteroides abscessus]|uniref:hypothetical protein n=1 Tax=Mycobacteroides abscessus TaxID=36809 RepID=UPI0009A8A8C8|nr:hypothetical protein [Mycobacteroides abscessus]MDM3950347.1 hypothetical protein [Mycobacteroides abscessus]SLJ17897.1 Uncharacterised protein [Mycobacteroides abscessus subsp. massiliense]
MTELTRLEADVLAEFAELEPGFAKCEPVNWIESSAIGLPCQLAEPRREFPREQWAVVTNRRIVSLLMVRNIVRIRRENPDHPQAAELWHTAAFLLQYGGMIRL